MKLRQIYPNEPDEFDKSYKSDYPIYKEVC
jgi:hypothetical protein